MKKSTRIVKRLIALSLVLLLSIETFAAVVGDNDGAAFITKAEFDSMKNDFQSQLDRYNSSIDNKIDGAIANYLSGIKIATQTTNKFMITGIQDEILMMDDRTPLAYKFNFAAGDWTIQTQREFYETSLSNPGRGVSSNITWNQNPTDHLKQNDRIYGSAIQTFKIDPTYDGHRTIISTNTIGPTDTVGEWYGYTETAQDFLNCEAVFKDFNQTVATSNIEYTDPNGWRVYAYQANMAPWSLTGYKADWQNNKGGVYAQFNSSVNSRWRGHVTNQPNTMEINAWSSDYGTIFHKVVCVYNPNLDGDFTVKDNMAWQRTANKKYSDGTSYYGTTEAWIQKMMEYYENKSELTLWTLDPSTLKSTYYLMNNWDGVQTDLGGQNQFYLRPLGTEPSTGDTSDAWVPALGFHSGITKWNQVYQNAIKKVPMKQTDGTITYKENVMLTEGLPLFEIDNKVEKYEFTLEFDKNPLIDFTLDPENYRTVETTGAPDVRGMVDVHVNDSSTPVRHVQATSKTVKITIYPEEVGEGTLWMKWSENKTYSDKYVGGCTLKLQNHNTYTEYREN